MLAVSDGVGGWSIGGGWVVIGVWVGWDRVLSKYEGEVSEVGGV